jgi:glycosyltransferase involved in cell wall biosynthesis
VPGARDYRMMTRQMIDAVLSLKEYNRFSKGIFSWVGFRTKYLDYHNVERVAGETDWTTWKLFKYAMDGIADFSEAPLNMAVWLGTTSSIVALIGLIIVIIRKIVHPASSILGWASLVCIILLLGGIQLLCLGVVGKYIGRIYAQVKERPIYIVQEKK